MLFIGRKFYRKASLSLLVLRPNSIDLVFLFHQFSELEKTLKQKLKHNIPVITVLAVMGTTEESAVDPLTEILDLREKFRTKVRLAY